MAIGLLGKKIGMGQIFDEKGTLIPVTLIQAGPCPVIEKRLKTRDGYEAIQLGFEEKPERLVNKPDLGRFKKAGVSAQRFVREFRGDDTLSFEVGQTLSVDLFNAGDRIDIVGTSKGRGFASGRKRHGLKPGPEGHGSMYHNRPGSNGGSSFPARTFPGRKLAGHMGNARVTVKNLTVVKTDAERNLLFVKGSIPGANTGYVMIRKVAVSSKKK
jgi:large subunit ribosomal protein L3